MAIEDSYKILKAAREVICVALNYTNHVKEIEAEFNNAPYKEPPKTPVLFIKPQNTLASHLDKVQCPDGVQSIQAGPALAVVMADQACRISVDDAMEYVAGYTLFNDFSLPEKSYFRPAITSKCYDSFGPLGPDIIDKSEIDDPHSLAVKTYVNGELRQRANTNELVYRIPALLAFISSFKTLYAGEVIATGFPAGRVDVQPGDEVSIEIDKVGRLTNHVVTESEYYAS